MIAHTLLIARLAHLIDQKLPLKITLRLPTAVAQARRQFTGRVVNAGERADRPQPQDEACQSQSSQLFFLNPTAEMLSFLQGCEKRSDTRGLGINV
jgi:hypothetical protein